jgi:integrase/recombinase XerD
MVKVRLRYVVEDVDRHGNARLYFRRKGQPKLRLPGLPGSDEFMDAYRTALTTSEQERPRYQRAAKGSFGYVCLAYYASVTFKRLDASTKAWRRRALDSICEKHGNKSVALMQAKHVRMLRDEKADLPGAARNRLKALRALFRWAVEADEAPHDPTRDVKAIPYATKGHHTWTLEEVEVFETCHFVGSKARLAMAIMPGSRTLHPRGTKVAARGLSNVEAQKMNVQCPTKVVGGTKRGKRNEKSKRT